MEIVQCLILLLVTISSLAVEEQVLLNFYNGLGMQSIFPAKSCKEIYKYNYASHGKSGYYWIKPATDVIQVNTCTYMLCILLILLCTGVMTYTTQVYCDMELSCGGRDGGWMRIGNIRYGDTCPSGWQQISSPVQACRGSSNDPGCYSASFDNNKLSYQHICGKVIGYQKGTPDAYSAGTYTTYPSKAIDGPYVDGVSLTYGTPRKHLFTYASGYTSDGAHAANINCPCARYPGANPPNFVRDNYYCESGSNNYPAYATVFSNDPLWDGEGCNAGNSCCSQAGMPWFYRDVLSKIDKSIEARICRDQSYADEGILIRDLELYIQ